MKHVTITLVTQENGKTTSAVLSGDVGDLYDDELRPWFIPELRAALNDIDPLVGAGSIEASTCGGIVADNCAVQPYDYVAEAKRATLQDLLRVHLSEIGPDKADGIKIAEMVNAAFASLEGLNASTNDEELAAAQNTIRIIQEGIAQLGITLPGQAGIGVEVVELLVKSVKGEVIDLDAADFSDALMWLKEGKRIARKGWNGKGLWLELQLPDAHSKMTLPYIFMSYPDDAQNTPGARVPWLASQTDMLASDWVVVE